MRLRRIACAALLALALPAPASAELRQVRINVLGMD
jgi:hypothetical protein